MDISEIKIVQFSELRPQQIVDFNKEVYELETASSFEELSWRFRIGFDALIEPLYIVHNDKILGQAGLSPIGFRNGNLNQTAIWFNSFIISPSLQGKGLGKILTEKWMALAPIHITNCNDNSMAVFRKLGWKDEFNTVRFALPINLYRTAQNKKWTGAKLLAARILSPFYSLKIRLQYSGAKKIEIQPLSELNAKELLAIFPLQSDAYLLKDESWFQWRFLDCPFSKEYCMATLEDAACIIRILRFNDVKRLHLVYQTPETKSNGELVKALIKYALKNKIDFVWAITNVPSLKKSYSALLSSQLDTRFAYHADEEEIMTSISKEPLPLQAADSDYDVMYS
jgi:GNAT superfamily N-acetyltransferase